MMFDQLQIEKKTKVLGGTGDVDDEVFTDGSMLGVVEELRARGIVGSVRVLFLNNFKECVKFSYCLLIEGAW